MFSKNNLYDLLINVSSEIFQYKMQLFSLRSPFFGAEKPRISRKELRFIFLLGVV